MQEIETRKSFTVKLKPDLLNKFNAAVKKQGLKNQHVVEQLVSEYVSRVYHPVTDDDGFYDEANVRWIKSSIEQLEQGNVVVKTFEELEKMVDG